MISIITAFYDYDPFKEIQARQIAKHSSFEYEHLRLRAGNKGSYSHGEALDALSKMASGDVIVALDSDAFPVGDWSPWIRALEEPTCMAVGIRHPRFSFIHPSFFAVRKADLVVSWQRQGNKDVGRVLSERLGEKGLLVGLEPTYCFAPNPDPQDPGIGSVYEDVVFHNWYTTRAFLTANPDGVSGDIVRRSINSAIEKYSV